MGGAGRSMDEPLHHGNIAGFVVVAELLSRPLHDVSGQYGVSGLTACVENGESRGGLTAVGNGVLRRAATGAKKARGQCRGARRIRDHEYLSSHAIVRLTGGVELLAVDQGDFRIGDSTEDMSELHRYMGRLRGGLLRRSASGRELGPLVRETAFVDVKEIGGAFHQVGACFAIAP